MMKNLTTPQAIYGLGLIALAIVISVIVLTQ